MKGHPPLPQEENPLIVEWLRLSAKQLADQLPNCNFEQVVILTAALQPDLDPKAAEKLKVIFKHLKDPTHFENIGKVVNASQMKLLLPLFDHHAMEQVEKLSHLFTHMLPLVFKTWLKTCSEEELSLLKKMGVFQPLQHQLTFLSHEIEKELNLSHEKTTELVAKILEQPVETISSKSLNEYLEKIEKLRGEEEGIYHLINRALLIAWNGQRSDLIEKFTLLKEGSHRMLHEYLGEPRHATQAPTGIYEVLELHFGTVFGNPQELDDEALSDSEPGIEALAKLNLWSLLDYNEIGLLPEFDEAAWQGVKDNEEAYRAYETEMHQSLSKHLEALGLSTVGDFKRAHLYTKEMLKEFIIYQ
jgi:hypothetical protein